MQDKLGLISYERLPNPLLMRELIDLANRDLSERLYEPVKFRLVEKLDDKTLEHLVEIDRVFRPELRYERTYYRDMLTFSKDATLLSASIAHEPVAFFMAYYDDYLKKYDPVSYPSLYFNDEIAVKESHQGNEFGSRLMQLGIILAHELGYKKLALFCEEINEQGVNLPEWYGKLGFVRCAEDDHDKVIMVRDMTDANIQRIIRSLKQR